MVDKIEQEVKDIPIELRTMRLQKQKLEKELRDLNSTSFKLLEGILNIKDKIKIEATKFQEAIQKTTEEEKRKMQVTEECDKEKALLNDVMIATHKAKDEVLELIRLNRKIEEENTKRDDDLKKRNYDLQNKLLSFDKEKQATREIGAEIRKQQKEFKDALVNIDTQKLDIDEQKKRLDKMLADAQAVKAQYEAKFKEADEHNKIACSRISELNLKIAAAESEELKTEAINKTLEEVVKETEAKGQAFDQMNAELENKKKEIEILGLKLQKLARDKGLEKELEDLKASLK